jgi:hypothetical protein
MKVATGTVVDGKVLVEGEALSEGSTVTVLLREDEEAFDLTPEEEAELMASITEVESGKFISGDELWNGSADLVERTASDKSFTAGASQDRGSRCVVGAEQAGGAGRDTSRTRAHSQHPPEPARYWCYRPPMAS